MNSDFCDVSSFPAAHQVLKLISAAAARYGPYRLYPSRIHPRYAQFQLFPLYIQRSDTYRSEVIGSFNTSRDTSTPARGKLMQPVNFGTGPVSRLRQPKRVNFEVEKDDGIRVFVYCAYAKSHSLGCLHQTSSIRRFPAFPENPRQELAAIDSRRPIQRGFNGSKEPLVRRGPRPFREYGESTHRVSWYNPRDREREGAAAITTFE